MPHRIMNLWTVLLGLAGLFVVGLMILFGADLIRASRTGPRWKRSLITAALSVASVLGIPVAGAQTAKPAPNASPARSGKVSPVAAVFGLRAELARLKKITRRRDFDPRAATEAVRKTKALAAILKDPSGLSKLNDAGRAEAKRLVAESSRLIPVAEALIPIGTNDLLKTPQWKLILDTWRAGGDIVAVGKSTSAQRVTIKEKFTRAKQAAAELDTAGLISNAEACLLAVDADVMWARIVASPPTDSRKTCYEMMYFPPAQRSARWLSKRLELVRKVASADKVAPAAIDKVMGNITAHLATLGSDAELKKLRTEAARTEAIKLRDEIAPLVAKIKRKALAVRLSRTSGWRTVDRAFAAAGPIAKSHRSTSAQRIAVVKQINAANAAMASMTTSGLLTAGEAELMAGELARLRKEIYRDPPTDFKGSCYGASPPINPVIAVTKRLNRRVVLLGELAASGRLNPQVIRRLLPSVRADIKLLTNAKQAPDLRKKADTLLKQIESRLPVARPGANVRSGR